MASAKVVELNAPRPGKKAVVLDIDYTIFDLNSAAERPEARSTAAQRAWSRMVFLPSYTLVRPRITLCLVSVPALQGCIVLPLPWIPFMACPSSVPHSMAQ